MNNGLFGVGAILTLLGVIVMCASGLISLIHSAASSSRTAPREPRPAVSQLLPSERDESWRIVTLDESGLPVARFDIPAANVQRVPRTDKEREIEFSKGYQPESVTRWYYSGDTVWQRGGEAGARWTFSTPAGGFVTSCPPEKFEHIMIDGEMYTVYLRTYFYADNNRRGAMQLRSADGRREAWVIWERTQ